MTTRATTLVFAGGGTGGHLFPAIAIANRVSELLADHGPTAIHFVGTKRGIEYRLRDTLGYPLHVINIRGIVRSLTLTNLLVPFLIVTALIKSWSLLRRLNPDVVIGTGGYVAWPILRTAAWRKIPTVLQEQNSFAGIATRKLAPHADHIFLGFAGAEQQLKTKATLTVSGNPVRPGLNTGTREEAMTHFGLDPNRKTIAIIGGSQGARAINNAIVAGLKKQPLADTYQLLWQTGALDYDKIVTKLGSAAAAHHLFAFTDRMDLVYAAADIAIARAGALTLAELEACTVPSVLIPYPHAAGDHQRKNAEEYADNGRAIVIDQRELESRDLLAETTTLLDNGKAHQMNDAIEKYRPAEPAVDTIAKTIIEMIKTRSEAGESRGH